MLVPRLPREQARSSYFISYRPHAVNAELLPPSPIPNVFGMGPAQFPIFVFLPHPASLPTLGTPEAESADPPLTGDPIHQSPQCPGCHGQRGSGPGGGSRNRAALLLGPVPEFAGRSRGDARGGGLHGVCGVGCSEEKSQQGRVLRSARNTPCTRSSAAGMRSG